MEGFEQKGAKSDLHFDRVIFVTILRIDCGEIRAKAEISWRLLQLFPMSYDGGSYSLTDFGGRGCDGVVGSDKGRNFGCLLN